MTETKDFEPIDIQVLIKVEKISTGKKTESLIIPGSEKLKKEHQAERYSFHVVKTGSEVGKAREPYFNRVELKEGDEIWLKGSAQAFTRKQDDEYCMINTHDILGVKRGEKSE